jgi:hypothetical protein
MDELAVKPEHLAELRLAEAGRALRNRVEGRLCVAWRTRNYPQYLRCRRLLLQRLIQLTGAAVKLILQISSDDTATAHGLWRIAALGRHRVGALRFIFFAARFVAPSHGRPEAQTGIVTA